MLLRVFMDEDTLTRMQAIATERHQDMAYLAELAVAENALNYFRGRADPAKPIRPRS